MGDRSPPRSQFDVVVEEEELAEDEVAEAVLAEEEAAVDVLVVSS